jgi:hypothetical protein
MVNSDDPRLEALVRLLAAVEDMRLVAGRLERRLLELTDPAMEREERRARFRVIPGGVVAGNE